MLGVTVTYKDMEAEDLELYRSLLFLINNPVADLGYEVFNLLMSSSLICV
jgi:E3 ubiquitin-protein ligase HUWE1